MDDVLAQLKNIVANPNMAIPSYGGQADKEGTRVNLDESALSMPYSDDPAQTQQSKTRASQKAK